nr:hypothetical protein [Tanacetum cinerariifolium]
MDDASILTSGVQAVSVPPLTKVSNVGVPTSSGLVPTASLIFTTASVVTPYSRRKGKEKMVESDTPKNKKLQEQIDIQMAREMEEQMAREDQRRNEQIARDVEIARIHAEEELKMMIDGLDRSNEVITRHLHKYEQAAADLTIGEKIELINELNQIEDFVPMSLTEEGKRIKRKGLRLEQEIAKKIKTSEDIFEEDLKEMMQLVPVEERNYWKIIRLEGHTAVYQFFVDMLKQFDREDLNQLWTLVKETLSIRQASSDKEKELWVELKRLFEPYFKEQLRIHTQALMHDLVEWRLYDTCGVHHTDDELTKKEAKQMEADDPTIQTIIMGLPKDIYDAVDSCETAQEIWLHEEVNELSVEQLAKTHDPLALMADSQNPYNYLVFYPYHSSHIPYVQQLQTNNNFVPQPSFNTNYMEQPMPNLEDISDLTTAINMTLVLMAKAFKLNYSTPTNNKQRISTNPCNRQIAQPCINMGNHIRYNAGKITGNHNEYNAVQNVRNQNANQNRNGNVIALRAEGNSNGNNSNKIRFSHTTLLKEAAKFVGYFKFLAKEADESLDIKRFWNTQNERLLRAVECKYDKILYEKAYNNMQHQIERLQAQLEYLKGKSVNTQCDSNTLDYLSQKLDNENVSLEFLVLNLAKENEHLKSIYKNLLDSIKQTRSQTKLITDSLQEKLNDTIYRKCYVTSPVTYKFSEQQNAMQGTSTDTKFAKPQIFGKPPLQNQSVVRQPNVFQSERTKSLKTRYIPKVDVNNDLTKPVTSHSLLQSYEKRESD